MPKAIPIKTRIDTAANWTASDPILKKGEIGLESDTGLFKVGDEATAWTVLTYFNQLAPIYLKSYTVAEANGLTPADYKRAIVWVSDETGGEVPAYCDGSDWRRVSDGAVIST